MPWRVWTPDHAPLLFGVGGFKDYTSVARLLERLVPRTAIDQWIIGCDVTGMFAVSEAFPGCRPGVGRGPDGADRALLRELEQELVVQRFDTVVIASGDHAFASVASRLRGLGLDVVGMAARSMSQSLVRAVNRAIVVPESELDS